MNKIKYTFLLVLIIVLMSSVITVNATEMRGLLNVETDMPDHIKGNIQYYITNIETQEVYTVELLEKHRYNGKVQLPYGRYIVTFIGLTVAEPELYEFDYGQPFTIGEKEATTSISVKEKEFDIPDETGWVSLKAIVPDGFNRPVFMTIATESTVDSYRLFFENEYKDYIELPVGEYVVMNTGVEHDKTSEYITTEVPDFTVLNNDVAVEVVTEIKERIISPEPEKEPITEDEAIKEDEELPIIEAEEEKTDNTQNQEEVEDQEEIEDQEDTNNDKEKNNDITKKRIIFFAILGVIILALGSLAFIFLKNKE